MLPNRWPLAAALVVVLELVGCGLGAGRYRPGSPPKARGIEQGTTTEHVEGNQRIRTFTPTGAPIWVEDDPDRVAGISLGTEVGTWHGVNGATVAERQSGLGFETYFEYARSGRARVPRAAWAVRSRGWAVRAGFGGRILGQEEHFSGRWFPVVVSYHVGHPIYDLHIGGGALLAQRMQGDTWSGWVPGATVRAGASVAVPFKSIEFLVGATVHYLVTTQAEAAGSSGRINDYGTLFHVVMGF